MIENTGRYYVCNTKGIVSYEGSVYRSFHVGMEHNEQRKFRERPTVILTRRHVCGLHRGFGKYYYTLQQLL